MVRARFTEEQIADFLQQSKTACRIRRYAKNMDLATARSVAGRRNMLKAYAELKQIESTAKIVFYASLSQPYCLPLCFLNPLPP